MLLRRFILCNILSLLIVIYNIIIIILAVLVLEIIVILKLVLVSKLYIKIHVIYLNDWFILILHFYSHPFIICFFDFETIVHVQRFHVVPIRLPNNWMFLLTDSLINKPSFFNIFDNQRVPFLTLSCKGNLINWLFNFWDIDR